MLVLQSLSYLHPNKDVLFSNLDLTVSRYSKIALTGNNGSGKSTLLKLISGELQPTGGQVIVAAKPYYVPQVFGQYDHLTIAQALQVEDRLMALKEILAGKLTEENYALLNDDWTIEERCKNALAYWQVTDLDLSQKMETLSGGQKTRVFLAGVTTHQPELVLLDEPSNHLDSAGRQLLYDFVRSAPDTLIVVSHDRKLLNLLDTVCELANQGIATYGGNYDFYAVQKQAERNALHQHVHSKEKALRKAKEKERETLERQQKLDARGKKKQEKAGVARIMMNTLRNSAENSTSKMKDVHAEKMEALTQELQQLRAAFPGVDKIKFGFENAALHTGKILFTATGVNFSYSMHPIWKENLTFQITSGERIVITGVNGSGKTTLIKLVLGSLEPQTGKLYRAAARSVYIDQDYSLVDNQLTVYQQAQKFNISALQEHEIKTRLNRFLFTKQGWDKHCSILSGGEKMRLLLFCLTIADQSPDMIILDEPTNNLDIQNIEILTKAMNEYEGTLIVVSHDAYFLEQANIKRTIQL